MTCVRVGEVTINSTKIMGKDRLFRDLILGTRVVTGKRATAPVSLADENCFERNTPASLSFQPATGPLPGCNGVHSVTRSPPPPSAVISTDFGTPPPPPPMLQMTTGTAAFRGNYVKTPCASEVSGAGGAEEKAVKTYSRILITEEILRSVVLKPVERRT